VVGRSFTNTINLKSVRGDALGGLTAAIVSLPLALAFGVASGAGPEAGLYGAIVIGFFAALFGGTPTLISEPTGPMTVVMTTVVATLIANNPENGLAMSFTVVMLAGVFQIILGKLKLGRYIGLMPYSVLSGFMSGIGVILIVIQIPSLLGIGSGFGSVSNTLLALPTALSHISVFDAALGLAALALLFGVPKKVAKSIPPQLIALVLVSVISVLVFSQDDIRRVGSVSLSLPSIYIPTFSVDEAKTIIISALMLGALGCIDSLLTAVIADTLTRTEHNPDKELTGQGIGNIMSGLLGGLPGAGATMGTVVNIHSGAQSALSGIIRSTVLVIAIVGASGLIEYIPMAVLAAIAIKVGINILDWSFVKRAHRISKSASLIMYSVLVLTVFVDLLVAVGIGMFVANLITIDKLTKIQEGNIRVISDTDDQISLSGEDLNLINEARANVNFLLVYFSGPMIFGLSKAIRRESAAIQSSEALILDLSDVPFMDATISIALENMLKDASERCKRIIVVDPKSDKLRASAVYQNTLLAAPLLNVSSRKQALEEIVTLSNKPTTLAAA
jgi:SulP family sulfate permease